MIGLGDHIRLWPDSDLPVDQRLCRLLEGKRTRYARREIFRVLDPTRTSGDARFRACLYQVQRAQMRFIHNDATVANAR